MQEQQQKEHEQLLLEAREEVAAQKAAQNAAATAAATAAAEVAVRVATGGEVSLVEQQLEEAEGELQDLRVQHAASKEKVSKMKTQFTEYQTKLQAELEEALAAARQEGEDHTKETVEEAVAGAVTEAVAEALAASQKDRDVLADQLQVRTLNDVQYVR